MDKIKAFLLAVILLSIIILNFSIVFTNSDNAIASDSKLCQMHRVVCYPIGWGLECYEVQQLTQWGCVGCPWDDCN